MKTANQSRFATEYESPPLVVEKAGQRYQLDLVDDSTGIDLNITKVETTTPCSPAGRTQWGPQTFVG